MFTPIYAHLVTQCTTLSSIPMIYTQFTRLGTSVALHFQGKVRVVLSGGGGGGFHAHNTQHVYL